MKKMKSNKKNTIHSQVFSRRMILLQLVLLLLAAASPLSAQDKDWRPEVDRLFKTENNQAQVLNFLESRYSSIPANDRRLATLIMAYCYNQLQKTAEESFWMTRHTAFPKEDPLDLSFISGLERLRVIDYRDRWLRESPRLLAISISQAHRRQPYFSFPETIGIDIEVNISCQYSIMDKSGNIIQGGSLPGKESLLSLALPQDFFVPEKHLFKLLLFSGQGRNEYELELGLNYEYPPDINFDPATGTIGKASDKQAEERVLTVSAKKEFDKRYFRDKVLFNFLIGSSLLLTNATLIKSLHSREDGSAFVKSMAWGGRTVVKSFGWGFNLLALVNLPRAFKSVGESSFKAGAPSPQARLLSEEEVLFYQDKVFVLLSLQGQE